MVVSKDDCSSCSLIPGYEPEQGGLHHERLGTTALIISTFIKCSAHSQLTRNYPPHITSSHRETLTKIPFSEVKFHGLTQLKPRLIGGSGQFEIHATETKAWIW